MKEMGTPDVRIDTRLNKAVWSKGVRSEGAFDLREKLTVLREALHPTFISENVPFDSSHLSYVHFKAVVPNSGP